MESMKASTVIVSGPIANKPFNGGVAWIPLSYILGLRRLGFNVYFVEQIARQTCVDTEGNMCPFQDSVNTAYFKETIESFGLTDSAALIYDEGAQVFGATYAELIEIADEADLLINISGHLKIDSLTSRIRRRVYIDEDPGFTQFWHEADDMRLKLDGHQFYFTMGGRVGSPDCLIPTNGIQWRPLPPPVVLDYWPVVSELRQLGVATGRFDSGSTETKTLQAGMPALPGFTTVSSWRGPYGAVQHNGKTFGLKVHEFRKFITLPQRTGQPFEIALDIHPCEEKDLNLLNHNEWQLVDPRKVASTPHAFRRYVQTSGAEFSVAQGIYVDTNSGWFSDRTVRYLASGKPALVQDTGFSRNYPVGEGLVAFRNLDEAVAGAESIARDYEKHLRAARAIAEEYFDSDKVLGGLIEQIGIAP
jgi:hypothetical protein